MKIDDIKDPQIRALAWKYSNADSNYLYNRDTVGGGFVWDKTKEGWDFWNNVFYGKPAEITEKMKSDHPEIFEQELSELWNEICDEAGLIEDKVINNKQQEEMKTTHTLENGTVLEVGKKYIGTDWDDDDVRILFTEILYFGNKKSLLRDSNGEEYECLYKYMQDLIPYEEPKEKIFEEFKPYIRYSSVSDLITLEFKKTRPRNETHAFYYTIEEAEEQGLDLSILNI